MKVAHRRRPARPSMLPSSGAGHVRQQISAFENGGVEVHRQTLAKPSKSIAKPFSCDPLKNVKNIISQIENNFKSNGNNNNNNNNNFKNKIQKIAALSSCSGAPANKLVRSSKFRHIFCSQSTTNSFSSNISLPFTEKPIFDISLQCCAVAFRHRFLVFSRQNCSSEDDCNNSPVGPAANGAFDGVRIIDLKWNPVRPDILAFSGTGGSVQIWNASLATRTLGCSGFLQPPTLSRISDLWHSKDVHLLRWHPKGQILLCASSPDHAISIWDVETMTKKAQIDRVHDDIIGGVSWSVDGTFFASACKKGFVRVFAFSSAKSMTTNDKREQCISTLDVVETNRFRAHSVSKLFDLVVLNDGRIFTSGLTFSSMREIALWENPFTSVSEDSNSEVPLYRESLEEDYTVQGNDGCLPGKEFAHGGPLFGETASHASGCSSSQKECPGLPIYRETMDHGAGSCRPIYDPALGLIYLMVKGEAGFRVFEITDEKPFVHFLTRHISSSPSSCRSADYMAALPAACLDTAACEIQRFLRLDVARKRFEQLSVRVPRRYPLSFKTDFYRAESPFARTTLCKPPKRDLEQKVFGCWPKP